MTNFYSPKECLKQLQDAIEYLESDRNRFKKKYNETLEETYKDNLIKEISEERDKAKASLRRGFGISEKEYKNIQDWITEHSKNCRGWYKYIFTPTALGVNGEIVCGRCGEKFNFAEIG